MIMIKFAYYYDQIMHLIVEMNGNALHEAKSKKRRLETTSWRNDKRDSCAHTDTRFSSPYLEPMQSHVKNCIESLHMASMLYKYLPSLVAAEWRGCCLDIIHPAKLPSSKTSTYIQLKSRCWKQVVIICCKACFNLPVFTPRSVSTCRYPHSSCKCSPHLHPNERLLGPAGCHPDTSRPAFSKCVQDDPARSRSPTVMTRVQWREPSKQGATAKTPTSLLSRMG